MANASGVALHIDFGKIPFISCARKYAEMGCFPGGAVDNKLYFQSKVTLSPSIDDPDQMLLFDPQTSGGLLLGVPQEKLESFLARAGELGQFVRVIGQAETGSGIHVS
jgi:selenide, water dikinase